MTKAQKQAAIERAKPLFNFLDSYDARLLSEFTADKPSYRTNMVRLYILNCYLVVVTIGESGWEIYLPASKENSATDTLKGAETFLGARPGDGHLQGEEWKQFAEAN
jgi:hypothetical protein